MILSLENLATETKSIIKPNSITHWNLHLLIEDKTFSVLQMLVAPRHCIKGCHGTDSSDKNLGY